MLKSNGGNVEEAGREGFLKRPHDALEAAESRAK